MDGKKTFALYHPRDAEKLYLEPFHREHRRSRIDFGKIDAKRFPRAKRLRRIEVELQAGDAHYIRVQGPHWTHREGLNFTMTRFFLASLWHYRFPLPGLKGLAGEFFHERLLPSGIGRKIVAPLLGGESRR